ncbi:hypothetical protein D3C80_738830 [compost metagenome]
MALLIQCGGEGTSLSDDIGVGGQRGGVDSKDDTAVFFFGEGRRRGGKQGVAGAIKSQFIQAVPDRFGLKLTLGKVSGQR